MKNYICTTVAIILSISFLQIINAQESASSASVSRSRAIANSASPNRYRTSSVFVAPDEVAVEEFINYHRHRLPLPKAGQSVALDTRWGNNKLTPENREAVLQVGFATDFANERSDLRPLNLSLVIDKSGSMAAEDKMSRVKESLRTMIGQLREDDYVSIVVFDSTARVLCPSTRVGDGRSLKRAIDSIYPGGSTNLHSGLMLGYSETQKHFVPDATNRVILLTDGIANVGTTEPLRIAQESSEFNGRGMDLSTIGVGIDLDRELLRTLSKQGRGLFHFVADSQDIEKVFVKEVQSLISPVARRVNLDIEFDRGLLLERVYGYEPVCSGNRISIPLDDMNNGLTQIVLMKFRLQDGFDIGRRFRVRARLSYFDIKTRKLIDEKQHLTLELTSERTAYMLADSVVKKNYTIAELAQSLYEMTEFAKQKQYRRAESTIGSAVYNVEKRYPNMQDGDIRFILDIVKDYQRNLITFNGSRSQGADRGDCRGC